jgi:ubiquitin thioesterase protein OTUB1
MERDSTISASVQDEAIMNHMSSIEAEVNAELTVGEIISLATLLPEYEHADLPGFIPGIKYLQSKYRGFRRIRRDGNCFYRGFLYKYLESLLTSFKEDIDGAQEELERFTSLIVASKEDLISIGFSEFSFDFFHEDFIELLGRLPTLTEAELFAEFQESSGGANSYTWYMRLLTSGKITS